MTFSLIAKDPEDGAIGIAVASRFFASAALVPYVGRSVAVASQAFVNPVWGVEGRTRLANGEHAADVLADLIKRDTGEAVRQCHMLDKNGDFACHTGGECVVWAGHRLGKYHSVAGNMLEGESVVEAVFSTYEESDALPFAERMLAAMKEGEAAGGDKRGRQSAGLVIHRGQDYPWLDIRVDDHDDPLAELDRLLDVAKERYLYLADFFATQDVFSRKLAWAGLEETMMEAEAKRLASGWVSRSKATSKEP
ncbi:pilus assembly protein [Pseudovibrio japonicus]|uniref:Pilus assembly protein n=1 Tax=Pseudovibrio japonicus TaxID=366534 RepID=A0ABQ3E2Y7_9HYPH|nr:DUF1028 domain-containing protein [Pseudovibrio japonicus]GHB24131.1 pilus assembly protein [Pseudovibrio japonicus]